MPVNKVIDMITVGDCRMAATRSVNVIRVVTLALVRCATVRIGLGDVDDVLVIVIFVGAVKVAVVQITYVVAVLDGNVAATRAVFVIVVFVDFVGHGSNLL